MREKTRTLAKTRVNFERAPKNEGAFIKIKQHFKKTTKKYMCDRSLPLEVYTDTVKTKCLGYVFTHPKERRPRIVYCASTGLTNLSRGGNWAAGALGRPKPPFTAVREGG